MGKENTKLIQSPSSMRVLLNEFKKDKLALFSLVFLAVILVGTLVYSLFLDKEVYQKVDFFKIYSPPNSENWLGTDYGGRDVLSYLVVGTRNSFLISLGITCVTTMVAIVFGTLAGYFGGKVDNAVMRTADFVSALPSLMFFIVFVAIVPNYSIPYFVLVIAMFNWVGKTRVIRAKALSECSLDYIAASKTLGTSHWTIMTRELLPNLSSIIIVYFTLSLAGNMGIESVLSFIGFGLPESNPSLGTLVAYARKPDVIEDYWWIWLPASLMIFTMMLSINFIGQALKRATDERQRTN